jgi:hypothetical protein
MADGTYDCSCDLPRNMAAVVGQVVALAEALSIGLARNRQMRRRRSKIAIYIEMSALSQRAPGLIRLGLAPRPGTRVARTGATEATRKWPRPVADAEAIHTAFVDSPEGDRAEVL